MTVVDKVNDNSFKEIRKFQGMKFEEKKNSPMKDPDILKKLSYSESYWCLGSTDVAEEVSKIDAAIIKEKRSRKER